ncbi:MAG: DUF4132 domain-containing protein, partial [Pseudomonadota bacterium]
MHRLLAKMAEHPPGMPRIVAGHAMDWLLRELTTSVGRDAPDARNNCGAARRRTFQVLRAVEGGVDDALREGALGVVNATRALVEKDSSRIDADFCVSLAALIGPAALRIVHAELTAAAAPIAVTRTDFLISRAAAVANLVRARRTVPYRLATVLPGFDDYAEVQWSAAQARAEALWNDPASFRPDKLFTQDECGAIAEVVPRLLEIDAAGLNHPLTLFWYRVCVAPKDAAKGMPSQSLGATLANAVAGAPTLAGVKAMAEVKGQIRHAHYKKKTERLYRQAVKALAARPDMILHLHPEEPVAKKLLPTLRASFEALFLAERAFERADWTRRFTRNESVRAMSERLVWRVRLPEGTTVSALPPLDGGTDEWRGADGAAAHVPDAALIDLWHPLHGDNAERAAWRDRAAAVGLKQPIAQIFREWYRPDADALADRTFSGFAGISISVKQVMGVAASRGWSIERSQLCRDVGALRFVYLEDVHPSMDHCEAAPGLAVRCRNSDMEPICLGDVGPVLLSEMLRDADLFTAVGARAAERVPVAPPAPPLRSFLPALLRSEGIAVCRMQILARLFPAALDAGRLSFERDAAVVGDVVIDLVTGDLSADGRKASLEDRL